jgi:Zn-dependent peptidase ImmA (M78 family)
VESIAEDLLGLAVEQEPIDCSGMLLPAERRILVNAAEPETRRRFTLAHELGHWICQVLEGHAAPIYCRAADLAQDANRTLEREANVFAAEVLMPDTLVREAFADDATAADLANSFRVSEEAMQWRLFNFGLVDERPV